MTCTRSLSLSWLCPNTWTSQSHKGVLNQSMTLTFTLSNSLNEFPGFEHLRLTPGRSTTDGVWSWNVGKDRSRTVHEEFCPQMIIQTNTKVPVLSRDQIYRGTLVIGSILPKVETKVSCLSKEIIYGVNPVKKDDPSVCTQFLQRTYHKV